jgi:hypothetical protein
MLLCAAVVLAAEVAAAVPEISRIQGGATKTVWGVCLAGDTQFLAANIGAELDGVKAAIQQPEYRAADWLPPVPTKEVRTLRVLDREENGRVAAVVATANLAQGGNWDASVGPDVLWAKNAHGVSRPQLLRSAQPWWAFPAKVAAGDRVRLFGRNLRPIGEKGFEGLIAIRTERGGGARLLPPLRPGRHPMYEQEFVLPDDLEPGEVQVYFHNGSGGVAGWGGPVRLNIRPRPTPESAVIAVACPDDGGDAAPVIQAALKRAAANQATVVLGPGIFALSRTLSVPEGVSLRGTGRHVTTLRPMATGMAEDFPAEQAGVRFEGYARDWIPHMRGKGYAPLLWVRANSSVTDLRLEQDATSGIGILIARAPGVAENVRIARVDGQSFESTRSWVPSAAIRTMGDTAAVSITDCAFEGRGAIEINGAVNRNLRVARCRLTGAPEGKYNMMFVRGAAESVIEDNVISGGMRAIVFQDARQFGRDEVPSGLQNSGAGLLHTFIAGNVLQDSVPRRHNDGENMFESNDHFWAGHPSEVLADGFRVEAAPFNAKLAGCHVIVCDGDGLGEFRRIVSHDGERIRLDRPWTVRPTTGSVLKVGAFAARSLWIDNRESRIAGPLMLWGSCVENVIDGHIQQDGEGLVLWDPKSEYPMPVAFNDVINSRLVGRGNLRLLGPMVFGNTIRCNEVIDFQYRPNYHAAQNWLVPAPDGKKSLEPKEGRPRHDVGIQLIALPYDRRLAMPYLSEHAPVSAWNVIEGNHIRGDGIGIRATAASRHLILRGNAIKVTGEPYSVPAGTGVIE